METAKIVELINSHLNEKEPEIKVSNIKIDLIELNNILRTYSNNSKFLDNTWRLDKRHKNRNESKNDFSINITKFKEIEILVQVKIFILKLIISGISISTINAHSLNLREFFNVINVKRISAINNAHLSKYNNYINNKQLAIITISNKINTLEKFFSIMEFWDKYHIVKKYHIPSKKHVAINEKYIPEEIIKKLDQIFKDENEIPLNFRLVYWMLRLIPNRIKEVLSMKIDCVKPYGIDGYTLLIPTFKQEGQGFDVVYKPIPMLKQGVGKYLIELIEQQKKVAESLQELLLNDQKGFLFTYQSVVYNKNKKAYTVVRQKARLLQYLAVKKFLKKICDRYDIRDSTKSLYNLTSHQFRHNAITDRLKSGIFEPIDITSLTAHKNTEMIIKAYNHITQTEIRKVTDNVNKGLNSNEIYFRGRIINSHDESNWKRVLEKPFAHRIGNLGICSDISNCESNMFECLACNSFIPNAEDLNYFKEQLLEWQRKFDIAVDLENEYLKENARYNMELHKVIIDKIKKAEDEGMFNE